MKNTYPCDEKPYICPYKDTYMGYEDEMCEVCCGLGIYEESYTEEELDEDIFDYIDLYGEEDYED